MRENTPLIPGAPVQNSAEHNVHGWERAGSVATGVLMIGKGLRKGGLFGLIQVAIGGIALARGISGHSSTKSLLERGRQDLDQIRVKIQRSGADLQGLKASAEPAHGPLQSPKS
ncbi:DUF2892 domain-containing protein [Pseudomonas sp. SDI]|uniref:YgaP family membrane protein n=1 Tax=Pseudomonas sp. SDI TaxID=2170734 RepID=UPI000DE6401B|nr:DUF2892 domain-containing protein [Pseudomonas sp. SDI]PWB34690.1 DUF2892 domain-containing protein [Pseudomonas sp. SDI]